MNSIKDLKPTAIWQNFYKLTQVPRPSNHEEQARKFMLEWAKENNIEAEIDEVGNIIMRKPATPGMENRKGVILQGHLDMVPQKNEDTDHDFEKDPIQAYVDGEWVRAKGTTLGADNGMGVAAGMAMLTATDIPHGPLEVLITATEETGMDGANGLKPGLLKGDILLNGHTHIPANQDMADFIYMNPGSVSIPKENSAHGYMIYDQEFIWKDLDGNVIDMM